MEVFHESHILQVICLLIFRSVDFIIMNNRYYSLAYYNLRDVISFFSCFRSNLIIDRNYYFLYNREVASGCSADGSARGLGPWGRRFKSCHPDQTNKNFIGPLVKRSRHRPFTAVTGVRFPHGSPKHAGVAQ
jgi:hypothetical protein